MNGAGSSLAGRWRPFNPAGLVDTVLVSTVVSAVLLVAYGLVESFSWQYWLSLAVVAAGFTGWLLVLRRSMSRVSDVLLYLIPGGGAVVLTAFVISAGLEPESMAIAYALIAVIGAALFPRRGQLVLALVTGVSYVVALVAQDHVLAHSLLPLGLLVVVGYVASTFSKDLQDAIAREADAASEAELRAGLLRRTAAIHDLDVEQAAAAAVDAMNHLGFEIATLGVVAAEGLEMVPVANVGIDQQIRHEPIAVGRGLGGRALEAGETIEVEDYQRFDGRLPGRDEVRSGIAVPIRVDGEWGAILLGGRRTTGRCTTSEREVIEVIAAQVGRAIENAKLFEAERRAVEHERKLDELKSEFVSNVSHELRTPLTVIEGLGQTLTTRLERLEGDKRVELLDRIASNANRLGEMIDAMLDFSRFEADGVRPDLRAVDLGALAQLAATRLEPLLAGRPFDIEVEPVEVVCDPSLIEHVIENLLGNAAKHTPSGAAVSLRVRAGAGEAVLAVEDGGSGIPDEELPYLTHRFFRGALQHRPPSPGLGLGLALVHQILDGHGSALEVENQDGGGARFSFRLPVVSAADGEIS